MLRWQSTVPADPPLSPCPHLCREPPQGHGQPGLPLTSSSLAAGDVYTCAEPRWCSVMLYFLDTEWEAGPLILGAAANEQRHQGQRLGGADSSSAKDMVCLGESLSRAPCLPLWFSPSKDHHLFPDQEHLSTKRLPLREGTEAFSKHSAGQIPSIETTTSTF